jgi:hypothetical protein
MVNPLLRVMSTIEPKTACIFISRWYIQNCFCAVFELHVSLHHFCVFLLDAVSDITHRPRREGDGLSPVHVVNVETKDTHEEATNGALAALDLMERVRKHCHEFTLFAIRFIHGILRRRLFFC